jgi:hypothetical protein
MNESDSVTQGDPSITTPATPPNTLEVPNATGVVTINFDELKGNSILLIKINPEGMQQRIAATQQIATALRPYTPIFKEKSITPIVMVSTEDMSVLDSEQMGKFGWVKKEESRIITLS